MSTKYINTVTTIELIFIFSKYQLVSYSPRYAAAIHE